MKKNYKEMELDVIRFEIEDVITTSGAPATALAPAEPAPETADDPGTGGIGGGTGGGYGGGIGGGK